MQRLASEVQGQPILDIGVGGGRTTEFLCALTTDYLGIDYLGELVAAARRRFPRVRFEQMDARDLSPLGSESFAAVTFSFNGIDGMSHADRARAFSEIHRVLRPGGWFAYSTMNLAYPLPSWRPHPLRIVRHPLASAKAAGDAALLWRDGRRLRHATEAGEGWGTMVRRAYGHPVLWHRVTVEEAIRELCKAGFDAEIEIFTSSGIRIARDRGASASSMLHPESGDLHILARRP